VIDLEWGRLNSLIDTPNEVEVPKRRIGGMVHSSCWPHLNIPDVNGAGRLSKAAPIPPSRHCSRVSSLMPNRRLFFLVKLGKNICYAYRARSVEAIRLFKRMERDLVARYGTKDDVHVNHRPGTVQGVDFWQPENTRRVQKYHLHCVILIFFF